MSSTTMTTTFAFRRSIHRIATRPTFSAGIRWSSYVGDVRCPAGGGVGTRNAGERDRHGPHERLLVLGSGVAGCAAALTAARHGIPVTVLHAGSRRDDCNSYWAQGGIIYRNYRLRHEGIDGQTTTLVDTPRSLVDDIRVASGYLPPLARAEDLEEGRYTPDDVLLRERNAKPGFRCPTTGITWNEDAAWKLAVEGPSRIRQLLLGRRDGGEGEERGCVVPFDRTAEEDALSLCLEASHAAPRIIHRADCTGKAITTHITRAAAAHPLIEFVGDSVVADLLYDESSSSSSSSSSPLVIGARVLDKTTRRLSDRYAVHGLVLASGGLAGIYRHSTNPAGFNALGSSVGLALRLERSLVGGASPSRIASDLEYVQFHPTALCLPDEPRFLLTEALRGEGAILRDADGRAFARDYHPRGELAPRDVVARAVFCEGQKAEGGGHNAFLDVTHRDPAWLKGRFPSVHEHLTSRAAPLDFSKEWIPVVPAAHYTCGGVTTDLDGRATTVGGGTGTNDGGWVRNLYAAGEAARTGLHGGNRLASTSLLEGLVFGSSAGETAAGAVEDNADEVAEAAAEARSAIERRLSRSGCGSSETDSSVVGGVDGDEEAVREATVLLSHLKSIMWDNVGVVRTPSKLSAAVSDLAAIREEADRLWEDRRGSAGVEAVALRDAAYAGLAVAEAALANRVSGGAHYIVLEEEEGEEKNDSRKEMESDDEDEGLVVARG
mmetsp:Transcript_20260/g.42491  ORF Transcript_20260/g.42491 Transcript_20260/m.42491 type:complete len:721 (-) Transcript_20260:420-2582(-)